MRLEKEDAMNTLSLQDLKPGMVVVFVDQTLNDHPACWVSSPFESEAEALSGKAAMVVAIDPDKPGKTVALCFKEKLAVGHSCDGRVPQGHGFYALPEHLYAPDAHEAHQHAHDVTAVQQTQIDALLKGFVAP
jgi:hypothetical protein